MFRTMVVYAVAAGCLAWVIHGVRFDELLRHVRSVHLWWIPLALTLDVLSTGFHGLRWALLLRPCGRITLLPIVRAIYAGLFTNEILPMKAGEFVRGYLVSKWIGRPFDAVLPSMITERIVDGSVLVLGLGLSAFFVTLPRQIASAAIIIGTALLIAIGVLLNLIRKEAPTDRPADTAKGGGIARRIMTFISHLACGLRAVWTSPYFLRALAVSLLFLSLQALSFWVVMKAYGLGVSLWGAAVVLVVVRLGTAIPNAPANIGPYQFFCVVSLTLFGIEKTMATGFAIVLSIVFTIPILALGLLSFARSGLTVSKVSKAQLAAKSPGLGKDSERR
jgi:uncharacterized protein (TIRG00374 family)